MNNILREWAKTIPTQEFNNVRSTIVEQCMWTRSRWENVWYGRSGLTKLEQKIINEITMEVSGEAIYDLDEGDPAEGTSDRDSDRRGAPADFFYLHKDICGFKIRVTCIGRAFTVSVDSGSAMPRRFASGFADYLDNSAVMEVDRMSQTQRRCLCAGRLIGLSDKEEIAEVVYDGVYKIFGRQMA